MAVAARISSHPPPASIILRAHQMTATYYRNYIPPTPYSQDVIMNRLSTLHRKTKQYYMARERRGLWWVVTTGLQLGSKKTVRSWAARRTRQAFVEALRMRGFDSRGILTNIPGTPLEYDRLPKPVKSGELYGSLRIIPRKAAVTAGFDFIRQDAVQLVDQICRLCKSTEHVSPKGP
jgi:hypothetical protein